MERHMLIAFPHPDDEAMSVSGTIIHCIQEGVPVTYACGTLGEMGRGMGQPFFANRETLPEVRKKELQAACKVMGIQDLRMMGFRDKTLEFEDQEVVADKLYAIVKETKPSLVITFYPGYAVHPDHDAYGAAMITALKRLPENERPTIHCRAFSRNCEDFIGQPDVINDVADVAEQKKEVIRSHKSQQGVIRNPDDIDIVETFWTYKI